MKNNVNKRRLIGAVRPALPVLGWGIPEICVPHTTAYMTPESSKMTMENYLKYFKRPMEINMSTVSYHYVMASLSVDTQKL